MRLNKKVLGAAAFIALIAAPFALAGGSHHKHSKFKEIDSIADAAKRSHRLFGTAVSSGVLNSGDEQYRQIIENEFNYMTAENAGKWGSLQPSPGVWNFDAHDGMVNFAQENRLRYKGHTLIWHSQAPGFINDSLSAEELSQLMQDHIFTTMDRYAGEVYAWDVVNEAFAEDGSYRNSVFYQKFGESYIADSFIAAHEVDPRARLYYNDYNIAGINAKSDGVYNMVKGLKEAGVPIHGVGFQTHLVASSAPSLEELVENFRRFAKLGVSVNISELDIRISNLPWDQATKFAIQRQVYHRVISACMMVRRCEGVTTWGFTDRFSWVDSTFGEDDPLLYTEDYQKKPAYYGVLDGFMWLRPDDAGAMPNLVANSNVEGSLDGWSTWAGTLGRTRLFAASGRSAVRLSDRTDNWNGAVYDLSGVVQGGQTYDVSAMASVGKFKRFWKVKKQNLALSAHLRCEGGEDQYLTLDSDATRLFRWKRLAGELVTPDCNLELAEVYVEGPSAGIDLYVDALNVRPRVLVPNSEGFGPNIVTNSDFEVDASGWFGFGDPIVEATDVKANSGLQSGYATGRTASWQGPATSLLADVEPGGSYQLLAWVSLEEGSAQVRASIKASCPEGDNYFGVGGTNANDLGWSVVAGLFTVPDCDLSELTLYFEGPDAGVNIYLDDVFVRQEIVEGEPNLVSNSDFESGTSGWTAWGGVLSATNEQAHSGSQSALLSARTATWQGPVYNLLPVVSAGDEISVNAWGRIAGIDSDSMNITVKTSCPELGESYNQLANASVSDSEWTELSGTLVLPDCALTEVSLYFDGPAAGVDVYLDDVVVTGGTPVDPDNLVANPDFESGVNGWVAWGDASLEASAERSHSGAQSARLYNRTATWQGPVYNLLSAVEAGASYDISAWTVLDGSAAETVSITIKTTCEVEGEAYNQAGSVVANDVDWTQVEGTITLPDCALTEVSMYFDGPAAGVDTYLDDVSVKLAE